MANGASRVFEIFKNTSENVVGNENQFVSLSVKTLEPLTFTLDDKVTITKDLYILDINFSIENLQINDAVNALLLNKGQVFYILANVSNQWQLDKNYPIGSIYISVNQVSPETLFGGTWQQIKDKFLLSAGDTYLAGDTGGEAEHILTTEEMPVHNHNISELTGTTSIKDNHTHTITVGRSNSGGGRTDWGLTAGGAFGGNVFIKTNEGGTNYSITSSADGKHSHDVTINSSITGNKGGGQAHNNMPPYLTVYMWIRVS